jgi:hypothetical protein
MTTTDPVDPRLSLLHDVEDASARTHLTLAWRASGPQYRVELVELEDEVSQVFLENARWAAHQLVEGSRIDYDPEWPLKEHEYFGLGHDELPSTNLFDQLSDFQNLTTFKKKRLVKPRLYVVAIQSGNRTILFGRRMAYLQVLKQSAGIFAAVWDGSTFNALEDSVATFAKTFDWIASEDSLFVLDAGGFHAEFRDTAALKAAVSDHVAAIVEKVGIVNADQMVARCQSSVPMASKLKKVAERGLHLTATPAEMKDYAMEFDIAVTWDGDSLVFDGSLESQWSILKLLDEDRTEGPVTHRHYESAAKREI